MKRNTKSVSAYMTLEVSLLFPVILTVLISIIYLFFFAYNRTVAFQNAAISALYGNGLFYADMENSVLIEKTYDVLDKLNENQYLALSGFTQKVEAGKNNIKVMQNGNLVMPILNEDIFSKLGFSETVVLDIPKNVFYIRQVRKVKVNDDRNN